MITDLSQLSKALLEDLAKMLTKKSGIEFVVKGSSVEPMPGMARKAKLKENGSVSKGLKSKPFFQETVAKWKKKHNIS